MLSRRAMRGRPVAGDLLPAPLPAHVYGPVAGGSTTIVPMSNRILAVSCVLAMALAGCPKKPDATAADADADAGSTATAATAPNAEGAPDAGVPEVAPSPTLTGSKTATPAPRATDAGAAVAPGAGPAFDACCCEVAGQPNAQVGQSECTTTRKGKCVKKELCAAPAHVVDAGPPAQQCCCDVGGKKELRGQSECTKAAAGKCVKMAECKGGKR